MKSRLKGLKLQKSRHSSRSWKIDPDESVFHELTKGIRSHLANLMCYVPVADGAPFDIWAAENSGFTEAEIEACFLLQAEHGPPEALLGPDFLAKFSRFVTYEYLAFAAFSPELPDLKQRVSGLIGLRHSAIFERGEPGRLDVYRTERDRLIHESAKLAFYCYDGKFAIFYSDEPEWISAIQAQALEVSQTWGGIEMSPCDFEDEDRKSYF